MMAWLGVSSCSVRAIRVKRIRAADRVRPSRMTIAAGSRVVGYRGPNAAANRVARVLLD
jgi:hypothetical protein